MAELLQTGKNKIASGNQQYSIENDSAENLYSIANKQIIPEVLEDKSSTLIIFLKINKTANFIFNNENVRMKLSYIRLNLKIKAKMKMIWLDINSLKMILKNRIAAQGFNFSIARRQQY